jgi:hypothetical protein
MSAFRLPSEYLYRSLRANAKRRHFLALASPLATNWHVPAKWDAVAGRERGYKRLSELLLEGPEGSMWPNGHVGEGLAV